MSEKRSLANKSEAVVTFTDYDDNHTPYDGRALRLRLSRDVLFVYIGTLTEGDGKDVGTETFKFEDSQSMGVDAEMLYQALGAMLRRSDRYALDRLNEGTLQADDPGLRVQQQVVGVPAVRLRA